jgi:hemerythrin-like domain-containing protein
MDATELLMADHRDVKALFGRFARSSRAETRRGLAEQIIRELSVHAAIEEAKLYPVIRDELVGGEAMYEESIEEHQGVKELLAQLDDTLDKAHTKAFGNKVTKLRGEVEHHVAEEETEIFPKLRATLSKTRLEELGVELRRAKASAPTRPHPHQPPATELTGKVVGALDRVRDQVSNR